MAPDTARFEKAFREAFGVAPASAVSRTGRKD
jgi:transcriptional regulator GlxA family with amidase domain